ncbi:hypothetical protein PQR72_24420 [Paraburkholderia madseniana]|uniref:hypothetical protein n=1 Tax=Paraburkholderia madseniana TaxID=2599607 RepID=UPI0015C53223|nr:hypothetical protein [Paraburkholderia madseniana]NPT67399.1 hypothetical protein [Paraburkholderia madseniana]
MRFEVEGKAPVDAPRESAIRRGIKSLRSYGPSSYASVTDVEGNYVQVGGGGVTCLVERYLAASKERQRAFHDEPSPVRPDGTLLVFSAGKIALKADEWFMASEVEEIFLAFLTGAELPSYVQWRTVRAVAADTSSIS